MIWLAPRLTVRVTRATQAEVGAERKSVDMNTELFCIFSARATMGYLSLATLRHFVGALGDSIA